MLAVLTAMEYEEGVRRGVFLALLFAVYAVLCILFARTMVHPRFRRVVFAFGIGGAVCTVVIVLLLAAVAIRHAH